MSTSQPPKTMASMKRDWKLSAVDLRTLSAQHGGNTKQKLSNMRNVSGDSAVTESDAASLGPQEVAHALGFGSKGSDESYSLLTDTLFDSRARNFSSTDSDNAAKLSGSMGSDMLRKHVSALPAMGQEMFRMESDHTVQASDDAVYRRRSNSVLRQGVKIRTKRLTALTDLRGVARKSSAASVVSVDVNDLDWQDVSRGTLCSEMSHEFDFATTMPDGWAGRWFCAVPNVIRGEMACLVTCLEALVSMGDRVKDAHIRAVLAWWRTLEDAISTHIDFMDCVVIPRIKLRLEERKQLYPCQDLHDQIMLKMGKIRRVERLLKERSTEKSAKSLARHGCALVRLLLTTLSAEEELIARFETQAADSLHFEVDLHYMRDEQTYSFESKASSLRAFSMDPDIALLERSFESDVGFDDWKAGIMKIYSKKHALKRKSVLKGILCT